MGRFAECFQFAAKAGALEGYLYERTDVEPLRNWTSNIERMYRALPDDIKDDVKEDFKEVLRTILTYGDTVLEVDLKTELHVLLSEL